MQDLITRPNVKTFGKIYRYPSGYIDIIAADRAIFKPPGWEDCVSDNLSDKESKPKAPKGPPKGDPEDLERARRRARAKVRRLALANEFRWFVTLTIDPAKIDSYDVAAVTRRLSQWCSNQVKRRGLRYVLVPEFHKSGRVHYHGFFSDSLEAVDSGLRTKQGKKIYNLPGWSYGFTTAIELYGEYSAAVAYVCKYIGKDSEKIGGRWYFSGGKLVQPVEEFVDISSSVVKEVFSNAWEKQVPGAIFAGVNGLKGERT